MRIGTATVAHRMLFGVCLVLAVTRATPTAAAGSVARPKKPVQDHPNCVRHAQLSTACTNALIAQNQNEEAAEASDFENLVGAALHKRCLQLVTDLTKCNMLNKKATIERDKQHGKEKKELGTTRHPCQQDVDVLEACHAEAKKQTTTTRNQMEVLEALDQHCGEFAQELQRCMMVSTTTTEDESSEHDLIEIVLEAEL